MQTASSQCIKQQFGIQNKILYCIHRNVEKCQTGWSMYITSKQLHSMNTLWSWKKYAPPCEQSFNTGHVTTHISAAMVQLVQVYVPCMTEHSSPVSLVVSVPEAMLLLGLLDYLQNWESMLRDNLIYVSHIHGTQHLSFIFTYECNSHINTEHTDALTVMLWCVAGTTTQLLLKLKGYNSFKWTNKHFYSNTH